MIDKIIQGNCLDVLKTIPDNSIDCCVTSPPYWALRDYGVKGQYGKENTPKDYVKNLVLVFEEVKRVLKPKGTLWLNLGDTYATGAANRTNQQVNGKSSTIGGHKNQLASAKKSKTVVDGLKPKDLVGIPWMVAFALRDNGWYLRQDIIWSKPNPMPESVKDRCTKSHEYIFLFSKKQKYYYDSDSIKTQSKKPLDNRGKRKKIKRQITSEINGIRKTAIHEMANKRSVWTIPTQAFKGNHYASFPQNLIVDCIKAGCPENGIVLDPFMGSGTTAIVAKKLNRNFIGIEINPEYIKLSEIRKQQELGIFN